MFMYAYIPSIDRCSNELTTNGCACVRILERNAYWNNTLADTNCLIQYVWICERSKALLSHLFLHACYLATLYSVKKWRMSARLYEAYMRGPIFFSMQPHDYVPKSKRSTFVVLEKIAACVNMPQHTST
jgi:hypothetical protein